MMDVRQFIEEKVREIKKRVGREKAVAACSGGVDSTTATIIVKRAIGDLLVPVFVDTGLLREGESEETIKTLKLNGIDVRYVDASKRFIRALKGVRDPEEKRRVIGRMFIRVFEEIAEEVGASFLVQGTIAPDWIESGDRMRDRIKTHHNVAGLPKHMKLKLIEPLRELYKDEVREVARHLGISVAERQPFPGPGLAVRIAGEVNKERLELLRRASRIVEEEIENYAAKGRIAKPWQYFAVLLPVRTTGVHGDIRSYGYAVAIRAIESSDGMSGEYSKLPHELLEKISIRITNEVKEINRVVYDITNKPPATIEWE